MKRRDVLREAPQFLFKNRFAALISYPRFDHQSAFIPPAFLIE
jgi:hypothetical protein